MYTPNSDRSIINKHSHNERELKSFLHENSYLAFVRKVLGIVTVKLMTLVSNSLRIGCPFVSLTNLFKIIYFNDAP